MIACILLASGFGRRFGENKLLKTVQGKPLYRHTLDVLCTLPKQKTQIIVVTQYPEIEQAARQRGIRAVHNPDAAEGIAASVRYGVAAAPDADWYAFFVADQPQLRAETVQRFLDAAVQSGRTLAELTSDGIPGNPTLFEKRWRDELLALRGDIGGRRILRQHSCEVFQFEAERQELMDVDTPAGCLLG